MKLSTVFDGRCIQHHKDEHNIHHVTFNAKESSVNKFNRETLNELSQVVTKLQKDHEKKGVLFSSGKDVFIVGADITEFLPLFKQPRETLEGWLTETHKLFNNIEDLDVPTVVAINGICLGGGFEFALANAYRIASEKAMVGLPEVKLGIYPGWGGTIRLPRLVGADTAIEWIAGGSQNKAEAARKVGAVDAVVPHDKLHESAYKFLKSAIAGDFNWKERQEEKKAPLGLLSDVEALMSFETAKAFVAATAGKNYPAPLKAVSVMQQTAQSTRDQASPIEIKGFVDVAQSKVAENLVGIFLSDQFNKKNNKKRTTGQASVSRASVVGAGIMGGGIAYQSSFSGVPITMKDINQGALDLGMKEALGILEKGLLYKKLDAKKMATVVAGITPTLSYGDFSNSEVIVEAVVENEKIKKSVLKEIEKNTSPETVITSNTSTISIDELAKDLERPDKFCGMHFFNPVHKMPLVEIIKGKKTRTETLSKVVKYALQMKKVPVVVENCPGFLVNRVLFPYFFGLLELLREGVSYLKIDKVMEKFGWPMGPCYLLDVIGMDTAHHAATVMAQGFPDRMSSDKPSLLKLLTENKRLGQKNGKGFYQYSLNKKGKIEKLVDPTAEALLKSFAKENKDVSDEEIIDRMMIPLITESARCLEEQIVKTPMEVDLGVIYGIGFPPFRGGVLKYADTVGLSNLCEKATQYSSLGGCYTVPASMLKLVKENKTFYPSI